VVAAGVGAAVVAAGVGAAVVAAGVVAADVVADACLSLSLESIIISVYSWSYPIIRRKVTKITKINQNFFVLFANPYVPIEYENQGYYPPRRPSRPVGRISKRRSSSWTNSISVALTFYCCSFISRPNTAK
jgi:hypothetical protein